MANPSLQIGNSNWAIKEDNLLGYSTAGTRFLPQPITMTRASAGTRVNSSGLVETVELLGSEEVVNGDFATDTDWTKQNGSTISGGVGNVVANGAISSSGGNWGLFQPNVFSPSTSYRIQFKARQTSGTGNFNVGYSYGFILNQSITSSFVDYSIDFTTTSSNWPELTFGGATIGDTFEVDNVLVKEVTKNNLARVDYDGTASSLLVEPQRTNVFIQNDISTWNGFSSYADETTAPDGTTIDFVNMEDRRIFPTTTISNSTEYTSSIYLKGNKTADVKLRNTAANDTVITLSTEWQRFELTATSVSTITNALLIDARFSQGMGAAGLEIAIYGGQVEQGSYPTSYIPTSGTTVTRVADQYSKTGISNLIGQTEGVIFLDFEIQTTNLDMVMMNIYNEATPSNSMYFYLNASNILYAYCDNSGTQVAISDLVVLAQGRYKAAFSYKANDFKFYLNGGLIGVDISGTVPTCSGFRLENYVSSPIYQEKTQVNHAQLYKTTLTDSELIALTTI